MTVEDEAGFREFVAARLPRMSGAAYLLTGDHHAAQDLVQQALVKLARHWRRVSRAGAPDAYVRRVIYHEHVSAWRRRRGAELSTAAPPERAGPRDEAADTVRRLMLREALARLTPRQRAVIVLRFYEDMSESDTAEALGCSVGTVKSQTHHALGRLRAVAPELADLVRDTQEVHR
ncbi:MAG TPA: SigE family RNA polymerase sigma factor [Micromonosporaceae bacterium]|nr:SigE family RNA polymerase sigma factor [Micromonosporaceae bacterium]